MKTNKLLLSIAFLTVWLGHFSLAQAQEESLYTQAELDQILAPVALYPDTVLSHLLIAATYPLEVVEAARWSRANARYSGQDAVSRVEHMSWDPSVKALVAFPELLDRLDKDIAWMQNLGDAFLLQEAQVTNTIQYLRQQAYEAGNLKSNEHVEVVRETRYIYIEPARPNYVYLPYYDPRYIYGSWRWAAYPPYYWSRPPGFSLNIGFYWGTGFRIAPSFYFSAFNWSYNHVVVVNHHHHHGGYYQRPHRRFHDQHAYAHNSGHGPNRWRHNPHHRRGVDYHGAVDQDRFTSAPPKSRDGKRLLAKSRTQPVRDAKLTTRSRSDGELARIGKSGGKAASGRRVAANRQVEASGVRQPAGEKHKGVTRTEPVARAGRSVGVNDRSSGTGYPSRSVEQLRKELAGKSRTGPIRYGSQLEQRSAQRSTAATSGGSKSRSVTQLRKDLAARSKTEPARGSSPDRYHSRPSVNRNDSRPQLAQRSKDTKNRTAARTQPARGSTAQTSARSRSTAYSTRQVTPRQTTPSQPSTSRSRSAPRMTSRPSVQSRSQPSQYSRPSTGRSSSGAQVRSRPVTRSAPVPRTASKSSARRQASTQARGKGSSPRSGRAVSRSSASRSTALQGRPQ